MFLLVQYIKVDPKRVVFSRLRENRNDIHVKRVNGSANNSTWTGHG